MRPHQWPEGLEEWMLERPGREESLREESLEQLREERLDLQRRQG